MGTFAINGIDITIAMHMIMIDTEDPYIFAVLFVVVFAVLYAVFFVKRCII
jgi:hypothetical protein